jgi:hypothetical protein
MLTRSLLPTIIVVGSVVALQACGGAIAPDATNSNHVAANEPNQQSEDGGPPVGDYEDILLAADAAPPGYGGQTGVDAGGADWLLVNGVTCTNVTHQVQTQGAPCGTTWLLDVTATCASLGSVQLHVMSESDIAYPQACNGNNTIACGNEGVGIINASLTISGGTVETYTSSNAGGSCSISTGPTTGYQEASVTGLSGNLVDDGGSIVASFEFEAAGG